MNSQTSYRERGRAIVLACLMVLSVVAMSAAFTGATTAVPDSVNDGVSQLNDSERLYQGQVGIVDDAWVDGLEKVDLYDTDTSGDNDHQWVSELSVYNDTATAAEHADVDEEDLNDTNPSGDFLVIKTDDLTAGNYHITESGNSTPLHEFDIREQWIDVEMEDNNVSSVGTEASETELIIDSNRAEFHAGVSADGLDADDLESIFAGGNVSNATDVVALDDEDDIIYLVWDRFVRCRFHRR
ncbi:MAG: surface glycoprotein [Natrialbaceae archaeon]|nr:surface glycoprotein [Natrialbaceae archaeon]